jgi:hypothetical protein
MTQLLVLAINIIKIKNWRRGPAAGVSWLRVDIAVPHARVASLAGGYAQVVKQKAVEKARRTEHCRI